MVALFFLWVVRDCFKRLSLSKKVASLFMFGVISARGSFVNLRVSAASYHCARRKDMPALFFSYAQYMCV